MDKWTVESLGAEGNTNLKALINALNMCLMTWLPKKKKKLTLSGVKQLQTKDNVRSSGGEDSDNDIVLGFLHLVHEISQSSRPPGFGTRLAE